jgi:hypothetical protein
MRSHLARTAKLVSLSALLLACHCVLPATVGAAAAAGAASLHGAWRLTSLETVRPDGSLLREWMGERPSGILIYQPGGQVSLHIMRDPRARWQADHAFKASPTERVAAFDGYYAYWGTFELDPAAGKVRHRIAGSLWPSEVGTTVERAVEVAGDTLTLTTPLMERQGEMRFNRVVFERLAG